MTNYTDYSLRNLTEWLHDVISAEVPAEEIHGSILEVLIEQEEYFEKNLHNIRKLKKLLCPIVESTEPFSNDYCN